MAKADYLDALEKKKLLSSDFYQTHILPCKGIIIKICRGYASNQADFEDSYQEVCLQLWKTRAQFSGKSEWSTWVYRLAVNVNLTLIRKEKKKKSVNIEQLPEQAIEDSKAFEDDDLNLLYAAIRKLSEVNRAIVMLHLDEKSHKEIAEIIGTTANNIGVRISRIKEQLKEMLDGKIN